MNISIHALREEGDTSSAIRDARASNFNPRPPRGGRHTPIVFSFLYKKFQSTPSARRATINLMQHGGTKSISIHALREEGDAA